MFFPLLFSSSRAKKKLIFLFLTIARPARKKEQRKKNFNRRRSPPAAPLSHHHLVLSSFFLVFLSFVALPLAQLTATARAPRRGEESPPPSRRGRWPRKDTGNQVRTCRGDRFHSKQGEEISSPKSILMFRDLEFDLGISNSMMISEELRVISCYLSLIIDVDDLNWRNWARICLGFLLWAVCYLAVRLVLAA